MQGEPATASQEASFQRLNEALGDSAEGICGCRPEDAALLRRAILLRGKELGGFIRQLVRLVRLAALASKRSYVEFFYVSVGTFRGENFRRALGGCRLPESAVLISPERVVFLEPAMRTASGETFDLTFDQMPRLAALLDVMHYVLGYEAFYNGAAARNPTAAADAKGLFWPLLAASPEGAADEVAQQLQAAFNRYLSEALGGSAYEKRQFQVIANFLKTRSALQPERIDNELLFDFWRSEGGTDERSESLGFKLYGLAVRAVLRFRRALAAEQAERAPVLSFGKELGEFDPDRLRPQISEEPNGRQEEWLIQGQDWRSPLVVLATPPCDVVKWLNKTERQRLSNFLEANPDEDEAASVSLMGPERFDLRFARTLLRVDVFGAAQATITAALRRQQRSAEAVAAALAPIGPESYADARRAYDEIRRGSNEAMLAAIHILGNAGDANALVLIERLFGRAAVEHFTGTLGETDDAPRVGHVSEKLRKEIAKRLVDAFRGSAVLPDAFRDMVRQARTAAGRLRRDGFRPDQLSDPHVHAAFRAAAGAMVALHDELDRLARRLEAMPLSEACEADRAAFTAAFQELYLR